MKVLDVFIIPSRGKIAVVVLNEEWVPKKGDTLRISREPYASWLAPIREVAKFAKLGEPKIGDKIGLLVDMHVEIQEGDDVLVFWAEEL